jgi:ParB-like chromosome segregation protein Spo0J
MAVNLNAGADMRRTQHFVLNPFDVLIDENSRGRFIAPSDEQIVEMAVSMHKNGQISPVECRRSVPDLRPVLVLGFTRTAAARLIRSGFDAVIDDQPTRVHDPAFLLKVNVVENNDESAFLRNIEENKARNATSIIDDVHNWQKLADRYGRSDAEIAKIYGVSASYVSRNRKLLRLGFATQVAVHRGELPVTAALTLADEVPERDHEAILQAVKAHDGDVTGTGVVRHLRELAAHAKTTSALPADVLRDDPAKVAATSAPKPFTPVDKDRPASMREMRQLVDTMKTDSVSVLTKKVGALLDKFVRGRATVEEVMQGIFEIKG